MGAIQVAYAMQGTGPPLYMVHGIGARQTAWVELIPHLQDRFTCVTHDLRGHGDSPVPPTPYGLDDLVDDLETLRGTLGHDRVHVIGHSLGGMIGPAYARAYPQRVLSVGLLSTAAGRGEEDRAKLAAVRAVMTERGIPEALDLFVQRWYTDDFIARHPETVAMRRRQVLDTPKEVFLSVFDIYAQTEMAPWLHELECPCLVLTGELDGGCNPRLNRFIAAELRDAELVILEGLKHAILMQAPHTVARAVREYLLRKFR